METWETTLVFPAMTSVSVLLAVIELKSLSAKNKGSISTSVLVKTYRFTFSVDFTDTAATVTDLEVLI